MLGLQCTGNPGRTSLRLFLVALSLEHVSTVALDFLSHSCPCWSHFKPHNLLAYTALSILARGDPEPSQGRSVLHYLAV
jgi:hypothetical protein